MSVSGPHLTTTTTLRTMYAWRRDDTSDGHSLGSVRRTQTGWTAHGSEVLIGTDTLACWFRVDLDPDWVTRSVHVRAFSDRGETTLDLAADSARRWTVDGVEESDLEGCVDVDVAATPLTNTFPIRRLAGLDVGQSRTAPVAWVEVPTLRVVRVDQTYRRLGARRWEYSDPTHGAFVLDVDADGVVTTYEGFAVRVPT